MELDQVLDGVVSGEITLDEVSDWVKAAGPLYQRPDPPSTSKQAAPEFDSWVDRYSDWQIRGQEFGRLIRQYTDQAFKLFAQDANLALRIMKALHVIAQLSTNPKAVPLAAFNVGYMLWGSTQYFDAVDVLTDALVRLRQSSKEPLLEVSILHYLTDALREDKQFDGALVKADELLEKATEYEFRGFLAMGLFFKGDVLASKGRDEESLEVLRSALELRRVLTDEEIKDQSVSGLDSFLEKLGRIATRFGHFDEAIEVFGEIAELEGKTGNLVAKAVAISDIGHIYAQAGEPDRSIQYLLEAADLADQAGASLKAQYWRTQARTMKGGPVDAGPLEIKSVEKIEDAETAYLLNAQSQQLALSGQYETAEPLALAAGHWAQREKDMHLEISVRNTLALCYQQTDREPQAIEELQKGIRLADWSGEYQASMILRYNLAKLFLSQQKQQRSIHVLIAGIVYSQQVLMQIESSEFRQQVIASSLSLYELYALILSHHEDPQNHLNLLSMTERVRARNLYSWLIADHHLESSQLSAESVNEGRRRVQVLRALEVELEVRHLSRQIQAQQITSLNTRREDSRQNLDSFFESAGLPAFDWQTGVSESAVGEIEGLLEEVLEEETAIVCLFSVPEGICPVVLSREKGGPLKTAGEFISWPVDERREPLARWTGNLDFRQGRGAISVDERHLSYIGTRPVGRFEELMSLFRQHLVNYLVKLLNPVQARKLIIIPHRELALIPYWDLMDRCGSVRSITLAPSLNVLRLCVERKRQTRGPTVLVDDKTNTLAQAGEEIKYVKQLRADNTVVEPDSFDDLKDSVKDCSLLHIAAHGRFNQDNPYLSGFLASEHEHAKDIFAQYASVPFLDLSSEPGPRSIRLMTVAECMANLSLNSCRLAVISTCESGIARLHGGGEMTGLPTSLLVAGAKSVIASLWPVNDTATAYLMTCFYDIWEGGGGKEADLSTALAGARMKLRTATADEIKNRLPDANVPPGAQPFSDPTYTDAFQCFGSW